MPDPKTTPDPLVGIVDRVTRGERRALAEVLTLVEDGHAPELPNAGRARPSPMRVIGITGSGGAGKSTLIDALVKHLRKGGQRVAVLASDPASPRTGGALLGDRLRVQIDPADEGVYFRSFSTRGAQGGLSPAVGPSLPWLAAAGYDVALIETVGVGQDQVAVRDLVDTLMLLVTPGTGDEIQWEKAGLIELADVIVVNKSDLPGADRVRQQLLGALALGQSAEHVPVLNVTAATGAGVAALWDAVTQLPRA
jgi:LAO/AO transport system kinase